MIAALALSALLADSIPAVLGKQLFVSQCASCHGTYATGTDDGPSLDKVGMARLDFYLMTGRMPAAVPWVQIGDRDSRAGQALSLEDIRAIEAYLAPVVGNDPPIPIVIAGGNLENGRRLYALNCQQCHSFNGMGGSVGELNWAPSLWHVPIAQVAEAIRTGPGEMPIFGEQQISPQDLTDIATYVTSFAVRSAPRPQPPFRSTGPIPEGAIAWIGMILLILFVFSYWRQDTPPAERESAVRRDAGEEPL